MAQGLWLSLEMIRRWTVPSNVAEPARIPSNSLADKRGSPVSQICALMFFPSMFSDLVANSTPIVDFDSRLNSFRVNRESTVYGRQIGQIASLSAESREQRVRTYGY